MAKFGKQPIFCLHAIPTQIFLCCSQMKVSLKAFVANQNSKRVEDFAVKGVPLQDLDSTLREKQIPPFCSPQLRNDQQSRGGAGKRSQSLQSCSTMKKNLISSLVQTTMSPVIAMPAVLEKRYNSAIFLFGSLGHMRKFRSGSACCERQHMGPEDPSNRKKYPSFFYAKFWEIARRFQICKC